MKIIDANTGAQIQPGQTFENINGVQTLLQVKAGLLSARALFRLENGALVWVPLAVRYTHPSFFLQKVAFIPS